jgi:2,6-dihydroxypseudooxynicotine hydrolase
MTAETRAGEHAGTAGSSMDVTPILNPGRMLADGIPYPDYARAVERVRAGDDWFELWSEVGERYERLGGEAQAAGNLVSAGEWLWQASLSFHYAQFMWFHDPARREAGQRRKVDLYKRAAPLLAPAAERIEVPIDATVIPGYLRLPAAASGARPPFACVVLIGGLESTKEESCLFEAMCLRRGVATFAFDGPGQGEMFFDVGLVGDFERYVSAILDHLGERGDIDASRFGVAGRSLGAYYALRAAACDARLRACVSWGACFDIGPELDTMPPHTRAGFEYVTRIADPAAARAHLEESLDLSDVAGRLDRPVLVEHGRHDTIFSMRQVDLIRDAFSNAPLELVVEEDGDHCCHNMAAVVRPRMADWIAQKLR